MPAVCRGNSVDADVTHCSTPMRSALSPNVFVNGTGTEKITGALQETYESTQTTNVTGKITITSGPEIDMDAGVINLN